MHGQVTAWRAGHVLGAAMFMVEVAGLRVLYTGDYSRLADRHMSAADLPDQQPHIGAQALLACVKVEFGFGGVSSAYRPPTCRTSSRTLVRRPCSQVSRLNLDLVGFLRHIGRRLARPAAAHRCAGLSCMCQSTCEVLRDLCQLLAPGRPPHVSRRPA